MQCIYPITIKNDDQIRKTNWKVVPCGKCKACRRRRQQGWCFRLSQEMRRSNTSAFLTMTYSDENLVYGEEYPTLVKRDLQLFWKRLRKTQAKITNDKIKYYAVGEYGTNTYRPHYHAIVFNISPSLLFDGPITKAWQLGAARVDECNQASINYVTKYMMKAPTEPIHGKQQEFSSMSKRLGDNYLTEKMMKFYQENEYPYIITEGGRKHTMPRYYKEKIFTEEQLRKFGKEALSQIVPQNLDEKKRFEIYCEQKYLKQLEYEKRTTI